jgi:hypothetical protein
MANKLDEMRDAANEAKSTLAAADSVANTMAFMLRGRMRHVWNKDTLKRLKAELSNFNSRTGEWKA